VADPCTDSTIVRPAWVAEIARSVYEDEIVSGGLVNYADLAQSMPTCRCICANVLRLVAFDLPTVAELEVSDG
jgi:hypothetical protein